MMSGSGNDGGLDHMDLNNRNVIRAGSEILSKLEAKNTISNFQKTIGEDHDTFYEDEDVIVNGLSKSIRRLYVTHKGKNKNTCIRMMNGDVSN